MPEAAIGCLPEANTADITEGLILKRVDAFLPLPQLLTRLFASGTTLFLGCSLEADRTVAILASLAGKRSGVPLHFAVVPAPTGEAFERRRRMLLNFEIMPLWYEAGQHGHIAQFLRQLADEMPRTSRRSRMPGPVPVRLTAARARQRQVSRRSAIRNRQHASSLLSRWNRLRHADQRAAFLSEYDHFLLEHVPTELVPIASE